MRREIAQGITLQSKERSQPLHLGVAKFVRQNAREHDAVFERVTAAGRRLRSISEDPPISIRCAGQVDRMEVQVDLSWHTQAVTGAKKSRVGKDQCRRNKAVAQQSLRAV